MITLSPLTVPEALELQRQLFDPQFRTHRMGHEGKWFRWSEIAGLTNPVRQESLENLLRGLQPAGTPCSVEESPFAALKLTCRAGSDLSMFWALAPRRERLEIESLHARVARNFLSDVQSSLALCSALDKTEPQRLIAASFRCGTTPEQAPDLHNTTVIVNMTQKSSGEFERLDLDNVGRTIRAHHTVYEEELTQRLKHTLGLTLQRGESGVRQLAGIPREATPSFFAEAREDSGAAMQSRRDSALIPNEALFAKWSRQGEDCGWGAKETKVFLTKSNRVRSYLSAS